MESYKRNKKKELEYKWDRQVRKIEEARQFVDAYKTAHVCADCGYSDPEALTFDHVRGKKKMDISQIVNQGYLMKAIPAEIDKCEVVCGNCHIKREKRWRAAKSV